MNVMSCVFFFASPRLSRTETMQWRRPAVGVTINPGPGYEGQVWGPWSFRAFARGDVDAAEIRNVLEPQMPRAGEDQAPAADVVLQVTNQVIQYMGGRAAEKLVLRGKPSPALD